MMQASSKKLKGQFWRYALLVFVAFIFVFPLVFMVMSSLKPDLQLLTDTESIRAFLPVGDISLDNYYRDLQTRASWPVCVQLRFRHRCHCTAVAVPVFTCCLFLRIPGMERA